MKFRTHFLLFLTIALLCIAFLLCVAADHAFTTTSKGVEQHTLALHAHYLASLVSDDGKYDETVFQHYAATQNIRVTVVDPDGNVVMDSESRPEEMDNHRYRTEITQAWKQGSGEATRTSATTGETMFYQAVATKSVPLLVIRTAARFESSILWRNLFFSRYLPLCLIAIIVVLVSSVLFSRKLTMPVKELNDHAKAITEGKKTHHLVVSGPDELVTLSSTMDSMVDRLSEEKEKLETDRSRFSTILETMSEAVILVDRKKHVVLANSEARRLFHEGSTLVEMTTDSDLILKTSSTLESGKKERCTIVQENRSLQANIAPIIKEGDVTGAVITLNDISDLKHLEQVRKDFVANVSHELKTPLTSIMGFSEILVGPNLEERERIHFASIIQSNSNQMMGVITDLLTLASLEKDDAVIPMARCAIAEIVTEALASASYKAGQKGIALEEENHTEEGALLFCSRTLVIQALLNLVMNAVLYSPEKSTVVVSVESAQHQIIFRVKDHGCGIAEEDQQRIFERFYRVDKARSRSVGGTGLGLSIVRHVAMIHGGTVSVESKLTQGSTFTLAFPEEGRLGIWKERSEQVCGQ